MRLNHHERKEEPAARVSSILITFIPLHQFRNVPLLRTTGSG